MSAIGLGLLVPCAARADALYGARAKVARPLAARNEEDATAAATSVEVGQRPMPLESVRDVLREVPGALAAESGGYGAFSSVSLRGADVGQTVWLLGDVPLNTPDTGAFDISLLPLGHLARLEVYRGGAPVWYGQGSIGGVVRAVPREAHGSGGAVTLGAGSFDRYELRGLTYARRDEARVPVSWLASVQATTVDNRYPYRDDRATLSKSDDVERRLRNADVADGSGLSHLRVKLRSGALDVIALGLSRVGGAPGAPGENRNARYARTSRRRALAVVAYTLAGRTRWGTGYRAQLLGSAQNDARTLYDPYGELLGRMVGSGEQGTRRLGARAAASVGVLRPLELTGVLSYASDRFDSRYDTDLAAGRPGTRDTLAIAPELRLHGRVLGLRGELRGSLRSEWTRTAYAFERVSRLERSERALFNHVYRLGFALEPLAGLTLRGSLGSGRRLPAFLELFGDGVSLVPSPELSPERGRYLDLGAVLSETLGPTCVVLELNGYHSVVDDKIVWVTNQAAGTSKAVNQGRAEVLGLELGVEGSYLRALRLVASANLMTTSTDVPNKQLPGQPKLRAYARAEGSLFFSRVVSRLTGFASVDHMSTAFFDQANLILRVPRTLLGVGAVLAFWDERLELAARVNDVLDARGQDYLGFPLPGRSFALTASLREERP